MCPSADWRLRKLRSGGWTEYTAHLTTSLAERRAATRRVEEGVAVSVHGAGHHAALQGVLLRWGRRRRGAEKCERASDRGTRGRGRGRGRGERGGRAHQFGDVIPSRGGERLGGLPVGDGEREGQRGRGGTSGDARREDPAPRIVGAWRRTATSSPPKAWCLLCAFSPTLAFATFPPLRASRRGQGGGGRVAPVHGGVGGESAKEGVVDRRGAPRARRGSISPLVGRPR